MTRHRQPTGPMRPDRQSALATAQNIVASRKTCEGCAGLRTYPRPMCRQPSSPNFRTARDTYHDRCASYSVTGIEAAPAEPEPVSRFAIAGNATKGRR